MPFCFLLICTRIRQKKVSLDACGCVYIVMCAQMCRFWLTCFEHRVPRVFSFLMNFNDIYLLVWLLFRFLLFLCVFVFTMGMHKNMYTCAGKSHQSTLELLYLELHRVVSFRFVSPRNWSWVLAGTSNTVNICTIFLTLGLPTLPGVSLKLSVAFP